MEIWDPGAQNRSSMYGLDNIWKSEGAKNLNIEKIIFKSGLNSFLAMHITNQ